MRYKFHPTPQNCLGSKIVGGIFNASCDVSFSALCKLQEFSRHLDVLPAALSGSQFFIHIPNNQGRDWSIDLSHGLKFLIRVWNHDTVRDGRFKYNPLHPKSIETIMVFNCKTN